MTTNKDQLGKVIARSWDDSAFKERLLSDPMTVLTTEGVEIPEGVEVRIVESTDKVVYLVLPSPPPGVMGDGELDQVAGGLRARSAGGATGTKVLGCNCWQGEAWN